MAGLLKKILPAVPSIPNDDADYSTEYSFAIEYYGPPIVYNIPEAVPVNVGHIPTAATVASSSLLNGMSLPVIQPIAETKPLKKISWESKLRSKEIVSPISVYPSSEFVELGTTDLPNDPGMRCESSIAKSSALGCAGGNECIRNLSAEIGCSSKLGCPNSHDNSQELSGSSGASELSDGSEEGGGFQNYMNSTNWESPETGVSSHELSSEFFSCKEDDYNNEIPCHVRRPSAVTFLEPESSDTVGEESDYTVSEGINQVSGKVERNGKKGSCYRCLKGNRFTEKEVCIVCDAKYCCNCALRAMGSMPEGRKCISCIGYRIDESKRGTLGKCSRMLKRLLTESEIKQVMRSEILSDANQLPPELFYVNDESLRQEELIKLQSCPNPPRKLKPGKYWYDNMSGYWGKEGEKPLQIISPQLNIGGHIKRNASNGNTDVLINNREITKKELWMLELAGVHCEGKPHFWVSPDGSYQEEGQGKVKGRIWDKPKAKLACAILSLPIPSDSGNPSVEEGTGVISNNLEQKRLHKLLLVGYDKSGTSTIFKQAKLLYNIPFSEEERQNIKLVIQSKLYGYLGILLEGREQFEEESLIEQRKTQHINESGPSGHNDDKTIYSISPRLKAFSDWLLKVMVSGNLEAIFPAASREYAPFVEDLWKDAAIQATYNRRNELEMLPRAAVYFLDRAVEISRADYEPSDVDILYAEGITSSKGISSMEFSFPKSKQGDSMDYVEQPDPSHRFELIRVHQRNLGDNCKWLEMFEDVDMVIFCVSLTDYDQFSEDSNGVCTNKILASKKLFESIVTYPGFDQKNFLLILNKFDLLEEKIDQVPLTRCEWFHDFNPVISHNHNSSNTLSNSPSLAQRAFHYIAVKFKRLFDSLTDERKLYVSLVTGLEPDCVDGALNYAREILKWEKDRPYSIIEESSYSIEASSSS